MGPCNNGCLYTLCGFYTKSPLFRLGISLKFFNRGLYALVLTIFLQSQLVAEYLYKDEVIDYPNFTYQVETLGKELYDKTGISLRLLMLEKLPDGLNIAQYEKEILKDFKEPTIVLVFAKSEKEIDLMANDTSLYEYFNKKQVLSPVASAVQAFIMALVYADSFENFNVLRKDYGGTILPLIAGKAKPEQIKGMYSGSMFNGYIDIAHQISTSKGIVLENDPGDANQTSIFYLKVVFYGFVIYGIVMYIRRKLYIRRQNREKK